MGEVRSNELTQKRPEARVPALAGVTGGWGGGGLGCLRLYYEQSTSVLKNIG